MEKPKLDQFDTIVIGAGLAGLSAAKRLAQARQKVCVIEARSRIGGRVCTDTLSDGTKIELGATWIGPTQDKMYELCAEYQIETFPQPMNGKTVQLLNKNKGQYSELNMRFMNHMVKDIRLADPWNSNMAEYYDDMTIHQFMDESGWTTDFKQTFAAAIRIIFGKEPNEVSALNWLWLVKSCTSVMHLFDVEGGAQQDRICGGVSRIPNAICSEVKRKGGTFALNEPVVKVEWGSSEGVVVHTTKRTYKASKCVFAIPPVLVSRITFEPKLDGSVDALLSRYTTGCLIKVLCRYSTRWWEEKGLNGTFITDEGPITYMADHSQKFENGKEFIGLLGFVCGKFTFGYRQMTAEQRKEAVLNQLAQMFDSKDALTPIEFHETDWTNEEWSRGCPVGSFSTSIITGGLAEKTNFLRLPLNNTIFFAGTEFALLWSGYMDGAVRSGLSVAEAILAGPQPAPAWSVTTLPERFNKPRKTHKMLLLLLLIVVLSYYIFLR